MDSWLRNLGRPLGHFFLWDIMTDRRTRLLLIWASMLLLLGTIIYHYAEGWSWIDALYFSVISLTTVGYGDLSPSTTFTKLFTIFYVLNGVGVLVGFLDAIVGARRERLSKSLQSRPAASE